MFLRLFGRYARLDRHSPRFLRYLFTVLSLVPLPRTAKNRLESYKRFFDTNRLRRHRSIDYSITYPALDVVIVAHLKDFNILPFSLRAAIKHTRHHPDSTFTVIVPDKDAPFCQSLLNSESIGATVLSESNFFSESELSIIKGAFGERAGWVIQQLLKIRFVLSTKSLATIVIDADTILQIDRLWVDQFGVQLLTPTWEHHEAYYSFLNRYGFELKKPEYTFVSHHMVLQRSILVEALSAVGLLDREEQIMKLVDSSTANEISPFSIDYELYAQYLYRNYPSFVYLERWANLSIQMLQSDKVSGYASVSIHSYNSK